MLGIDDVWVWLPYVLCLISTAGCIVYGVVSWNRDGVDVPPAPEDLEWAKEERDIEEAM